MKRSWFVAVAAAAFSVAAAAQDLAKVDPLAKVDEILLKVSEISGIPIKHKVKSEVVTRDQIRAYIVERMKETTTSEEMHAQEAVLMKLGLLPAGFQLEKFVVDLLTEQATAFYDPKQKKFFLSDWAPSEIQNTAIAHELMHALQDQYLDLNEFLEAKKLNQDEQMARKAVVEGEGVLAMMDYMMAPMGGRAADLGDLSKTINEATRTETMKFPVFASAPAYLRETLLFPYTGGLSYTQAKAKGPGKGVYALLLKTPPRSTHEVMHPEAATSAPLDLQPPVPSKETLAGFKRIDSNTLGELDLSILLRELVDEETSRAVAPNWRGMRYDLYENAAGKTLLVHRSQWKDAASARAFAEAYRKAIAKKHGDANSRVEVRDAVVDVVDL